MNQKAGFETLSNGEFDLTFNPLSTLIFRSTDGKKTRITFSGEPSGIVTRKLKEQRVVTNVVLNPEQLAVLIDLTD